MVRHHDPQMNLHYTLDLFVMFMCKQNQEYILLKDYKNGHNVSIRRLHSNHYRPSSFLRSPRWVVDHDARQKFQSLPENDALAGWLTVYRRHCNHGSYLY